MRLRQSMSESARARADTALLAHLKTYLEQHFGPLAGLNVSAYLPIKSEPDLSSIFAELGELSLPSVTDAQGPLTFLRYTTDMPLVTQRLNVRVPEKAEVVVPQLLLIPCVGFHKRKDARFDRLGYGGGYYDRTLAHLGAVPTIGIAYAACAIEHFEAQEHDRALDMVITEKGPMG
jgi:5,10-methenyltetrahydrofolate synthetase